MDGLWLFKLDNAESGPQPSSDARTAGWKPVKVPNAWNAGDDSEASSSAGRRLVSQGLPLPERVESGVVGRALRVGQLPLEDLAQRQADRQQPRRLPAVRDPPARGADQAPRRQPPGHPRRQPPQADRLPALGPVDAGKPTGGWWNYGGLLREVYLRKINDIDFNTVAVQPDLPCATCTATVRYRVTLRNYGSSARRVHVTGALRRPLGQPRHRGGRRQALRDLHGADPRRAPAAVVAGVARTSTTRRCARSVGRPRRADYTLKTRHPLDQGRRRAPVPQRPADELPRRRPARGHPSSASRSTTRSATSSSPGSRSSARR